MSFSLEQTKELQVNSIATNNISNTHIIKEIMLPQIIEVFVIVICAYEVERNLFIELTRKLQRHIIFTSNPIEVFIIVMYLFIELTRKLQRHIIANTTFTPQHIEVFIIVMCYFCWMNLHIELTRKLQT